MTRLQKIAAGAALFLAVTVEVALAASTTYTYKDAALNTFLIQIFGSGPYYTAMVLENSSGTEVATAGAPLRTDPTGTTTQPVSASALPLPTGAATAANQAATQGTPGSTAPSKGDFIGGVYNSSLPSPSTGQYEPIQLDASGRLIVNCVTGCAGSGGTAVVDETAFTYGTTSITPVGGFYQTTATSNALTNGQTGSWQMTAQRAGFVNLRTAAGVETGTSAAPLQVTGANGTFPASQSGSWTATVVQGTGSNLHMVCDSGCSGNTNITQWNSVNLGSPSAYGTSPGAVSVIGVNAFVTNVPAVTQSGTWTVQPGNTANTTPWLSTINQGGNSATVTASNALKVDGSAVTQPVSIAASIPLPTNAATSALQTTSNSTLSTINTSLGTINTTLGSPMQASGGSVTANAGTNLNTSALATSANQATNAATTAHTCSTAGYSELGCLGQIDDDVRSPGAVYHSASTYNTIAASQSTQALTGGSGGATGDYLDHCTVIPASTSPGVVTIIDNATTIYAFPGGASSLTNLVPFTIPVYAVSVSGAWKVTTGANLSAVCVGKFH